MLFFWVIRGGRRSYVLATAAGGEVEVVERGDAADGFIGGAGGADLFSGRHGDILAVRV